MTTASVREEVQRTGAVTVLQRPEWVDARAVTAIFGIGRSTLYRLAEAGRIKTVSLRERGCSRGKRLFSTDSISAFLESRATGGEVGE